VTLRFAPLVATVLLAISRLDAAEQALPQLTAQSTRLTEKEYIASGDARLAHKDLVLYADEIVYGTQDRVAVARGNVILIRGAQRLVAEEVTYRYEDGVYTVGRFRVGQGNLLASGSSGEGADDGLRVENAVFNYGEPEPLSPTIRARTVTYQPAEQDGNSTAIIEGGRLGIGTTNIIPLPRLKESPDRPAISGVKLDAGFSSDLGAEFSIAVTSPFTSTVNLGADLGIFTKRGVLLGPIGDYDTFGADGIGARGEFRTGFIKDQSNPGLDIRNQAIGTERGYIEWEHYQVVQPGLTIAGQLNYWSDSYVTRDFRSDGFRDLQTPDTWLEAAKAGDNYVVSLFSRVQVNDYAVVQERLPEVRFDGLPVEIGGGIYHRINASVAALREDDPFGGGTTRSDRSDLYYGINRPFSPREWLSVTPTAGARVTHYERLTPGSPRGGNYTRVLGEIGFDSKLFESSATWDYKNEHWGIDGLRHIITPKVGYRYSPSADVGQADIPGIDRDVVSYYMRPLGIANRRDIDRLPSINTFRFGVDNVLQTRDSTYGSRDLVRLNVAVDQYASSEAASTSGDTRGESDIHTFLALTPAQWLRFDLYNRTVAQTGTIEEMNTGLTLTDANVWSLRIGTYYLADNFTARKIQEYTADYGLRLNEIYSIAARLRYDSPDGRFTEQTYAFRQRFNRTWTVSYEVSFYDGPRRESDIGFGVSLETEGF
jgi:LPS-assembly protein